MKKIFYFILSTLLLVVVFLLFISPVLKKKEVQEEAPVEIKEVVLEKESQENKEEILEKDIQNNFEIIGTSGHSASGTVRLIKSEEGTVARFENFSTINGPNLHIYLAKDLKAEEFIDIGEIKGTSGNINYTIPSDINISEYKYIMHWCVPFGVLFNYAEIN